MRTLSTLFALTLSTAFAQSPFYFTQNESPAEMRAMATMIRTVADIRDVTVDEAKRSLAVQATDDKAVVADWIFHQLDKPAGLDHSGPVPEYQMPGPNGDVVKIVYVPQSSSNADITAAVTAIRTVADLQRMFPYESQKAIVMRGDAARVAAADWMLRQLNPVTGAAPTTDSPAYPSPFLNTHEPDAVIRIFRMDPDTPNSQLTAMVTAIRTVADLQRLFPYEAGKAVIANGPPDKVAAADWLIHQVGKNADPHASHQTTLAGETVRLFHIGPQYSNEDLVALVTQMRTTLGIQRIFPFSGQSAFVLRGQPEKMPIAEGLASKYAVNPQ